MRVLIFLVLVVLQWGCKLSSFFPTVPKIEYVGVSKSQVENLKDSLTLFFRFEDAEGDLGGANSPNTDCDLTDVLDTSANSCYKNVNWNLFVVDTRNQDGFKPFMVPIPTLALIPKNEQEPLSGIISVQIFAPGCKPLEKVRDTVVYSIQIKDQAGNMSNKIQTAPIIIYKP